MPDLTTTQAAQLLGVGAAAVRAMIRVGTLPARRIGPMWLVRRADVEAARTRPGRGRPRKKPIF
jgi:excisionase family DNA binding protein